MSGLVSGRLDDDKPFLRLFRFRPMRPEFDAILRDVMLPDLATRAGLCWALVGRQGPGQTGERLVASLWASRASMSQAVGDDLDHAVFHPEFLSATEDRRLDVAPAVVALGDPTAEAPRIIRLVIGMTVAGRAADYLERAAIGAANDVAAGRGPLSVHIALTGPDSFLTLSTWADWSTVAEATGGSVVDPDATRHTELLQQWHAEHYEVASVQEPANPPSSGQVMIGDPVAGDPVVPETEDVA